MPPELLPRPCGQPGCPETVTGRQGRCLRHRRELYKLELSGRVVNPFYKTALWARNRNPYIRSNPFCEAPGCGAPGRTVDHICPIAAGGERTDPRNFATLCPSCDGYKRNLERHYPDYFLRLVDTFEIYEDKGQLLAEIFDRAGGPRVLNMA